MTRWQLIALLSITTVAAAVIVPRLQASDDVDVEHRTALSDPARASEWSATTPAPTASHIDALHIRAGLDRGVLSGGDSERYLVVEVSADEAEGRARMPVNLALVVDVSGSMSASRKMEYAYQAARELVDQLDERDLFSLVAFDDVATTVLPPTPVADRAALYQAIDGMYRGGGTDIYRGLNAGLLQLRHSEHPGAKRVVLLSDGQDSSSVSALASSAGADLERGVTVSALGVGLDFAPDKLMAIAAAGGGKYHYVDDPSALSAMFQDELNRAGSVAARAARIEIDVAEGVELLEVYGYDGYSGGATDSGWSAFLGDVYSGQTRKIVARVRVPRGTPDGQVATVRATFINPALDQARAGDLAIDAAWGSPEAVSASADASLGLHAARAVAGLAMKQSSSLWSSGDADEAAAAARARIDELSLLGQLFGVELVEQPLANLESLLARQDTVAFGSRDALEMGLSSQLRALGYME